MFLLAFDGGVGAVAGCIRGVGGGGVVVEDGVAVAVPRHAIGAPCKGGCLDSEEVLGRE